jgi:hypothetical protein
VERKHEYITGRIQELDFQRQYSMSTRNIAYRGQQ